MSAPVPIPVPAAAAPAPVPAHTPPAAPITQDLDDALQTITIFATLGLIPGTYLCMRELSHPWRPYHIGIIIAIAAMWFFELLFLLHWAGVRTGIISQRVATLGATFLHRILVVLVVAAPVGTYFAGRELHRPWQPFHIAIIPIMALLGILNLMWIVFFMGRILDIRGFIRGPKMWASRQWLYAQSVPQPPRMTREDAEAELEMEGRSVI